MGSLVFFLRSAIKNLRRGGERTLVALMCIVFGVMSLVAMTLVAGSLDRAMVLRPEEMLGADASLGRQTEATISDQALAQLDKLVSAGHFTRYTLIAYTTRLAFRRTDSGELFFPAAGLGVDPADYPLAGRLQLSQPSNTGLATLLQNPGDVVLTRDLAEESGLQVGDPIILSDLETGSPLSGTLRGIASDTPNHQGGKVYYSLDTASHLAGGQPVVNTVLALGAGIGGITADLVNQGWFVTTAPQLAENDEAAQNLFDLLLKGAGLMGLMVGGIGVANTMQVMLKRRLREVAILKTVGYRERHLVGIFGLEAGVLGLVGSALGAGLGLAVSHQLVALFGRTTNLLIGWSFSPYPVVVGALVGLVTTLIFALWAIFSASQVEPAALLRDEPVQARRMPWLRSLGLGLVLAAAFTTVISLVLGSLIKGLGLLCLSLAGLAVLGGGLVSLVLGAARLMPGQLFPTLRMARSSLRRRAFGLVFALIALFTGIVALSFATVVTQSAQGVVATKETALKGDNLRIIAPAGQQAAIRQALGEQDLKDYQLEFQTPLASLSTTGMDFRPPASPKLILREDPGEYVIEGATWGSGAGVYAYRGFGLAPGTEVKVQYQNGASQTLKVIGTYDINWGGAKLPLTAGLLAPGDAARLPASPDLVTFFVTAPEGQLDRLTRALGQALPGATVINLVAYAARFTQQVHNLYVLGVAMAGLALLAGVLLIANAVSLGMLDRRYELGILKAIGYSRRHILGSLAVEYSLVGAVAVLTGLAAVRLFFLIIGLANPMARGLLVMTPLSLILIVGGGLGMVLATALGISWKPAGVSPTLILNDRSNG